MSGGVAPIAWKGKPIVIAGYGGLSALSRGFLYAGGGALLASHRRVANDSVSALTVDRVPVWRRNPLLLKTMTLNRNMAPRILTVLRIVAALLYMEHTVAVSPEVIAHT